jgi:hypothetical protein
MLFVIVPPCPALVSLAMRLFPLFGRLRVGSLRSNGLVAGAALAAALLSIADN